MHEWGVPSLLVMEGSRSQSHLADQGARDGAAGSNRHTKELRMGEESGTSTKSVEKLLADNASLRKSVQALSEKAESQEQELKSLKEVPRRKEEPEKEAAWGVVDEGRLRSVVQEELKGWWNQQVSQAQAQQQAVSKFRQERTTWLTKAYADFGEKDGSESPLAKRARDIFADPANGLSRYAEDGSVIPVRPDAEYDAFARAQLELQKQGVAKTEAKAGASFSSTGGSTATASIEGNAELSDDDFLKMTPEQKAAWQRQQWEGKNLRTG